MRKRTVLTRPLSLAAIEAAIGENVALGFLEVWGVDEAGQPLYKVTPKGEARVEVLLHEPPAPADGSSG